MALLAGYSEAGYWKSMFKVRRLVYGTKLYPVAVSKDRGSNYRDIGTPVRVINGREVGNSVELLYYCNEFQESPSLSLISSPA